MLIGGAAGAYRRPVLIGGAERRGVDMATAPCSPAVPLVILATVPIVGH